MSSAYQFAKIGTEPASLNALSHFLGRVFEQSDLFSDDYLRWQYAANPDGQVVGFNALQNDQIVAHYALQPFRAEIDGQSVACLLSLNTATDAAHRGKGLFIQLAEQSYALAKKLGYELIIGVANANSMPGFVNKLGFATLGPLDVSAGVGPLPQPKDEPMRYRRLWSKESLAWRLNKPKQQYRWKNSQLMAPTAYKLIEASLGHFENRKNYQRAQTKRFIKLYLGLDPRLNFGWRYLSVPQSVRPSPLHFIYKNIGDQEYHLERKSTLFQALDFDAY
ncbi:MAG: GNAT family N-acetyltransferase [Bacteroidia bacterium]